MFSVQQMRLMRPWQSVIANFLNFAEGGYVQGIELWSPVTEQLVLSQDMFTRLSENVFAMKMEYFPVDPDLKYVQINRNAGGGESRLTVELTMIDFDRLGKFCGTPRSDYKLHGKRILCRGTPILDTVTRQWFGKPGHQERHPRTQLKTVDPLRSVDPNALIDFFDVLWGENLCCEEWQPKLEDPEDAAELVRVQARLVADRTMSMRQIMSMQLQQKLEMCMRQDQRPILTTLMRQEMRLVAWRAQFGEVLQMSNASLARYIEKRIAENPVLQY